jgi:transglutaminase superfamily protein
MHEIDFYRGHSAITDPGAHASLLAELPTDLARLREVPRNLNIHYRRALAKGIDVDASSRRGEARIRRVDRMLAHVEELAPRPLADPREPAERLIGHCRTSAVLMTAFLRAQGLPARARATFSGYWDQDIDTDHWVAEYWSEGDGRWVVTDPDLDDEEIAEGNLQFDPADMPRDQFSLAGTAWLLLRAGEARPEAFGEDRASFGLDYVRAHLLRDVASLSKLEPGPFDRWGIGIEQHTPSPEELELLDELARLSTLPDGSTAALRELYAASPLASAPPEIADDGDDARRHMHDVPDIWRERPDA